MLFRYFEVENKGDALCPPFQFVNKYPCPNCGVILGESRHLAYGPKKRPRSKREAQK
jgi:hypothetical protein